MPTGKIDTTVRTTMDKLAVGTCLVSCSAYLLQNCLDNDKEINRGKITLYGTIILLITTSNDHNSCHHYEKKNNWWCT